MLMLQMTYFYSANCGRSKDYVILNVGPIATFRSDNIIWDFKDLSIREIRELHHNLKSMLQRLLLCNIAPYQSSLKIQLMNA